MSQPLRLVLDSRGRTPAGARVLAEQEVARTVVCCTPAAPADWRAGIAATGARVVEFPAAADGRVDLPALLDWLGAEGVVSLIVEGGGRVHGAFFDARLVQEVRAVVAPMVIGGDAAAAVVGIGALRMADVVQLRDLRVDQLGGDVLVTARPVAPAPAEALSIRRATPADAASVAALAEDVALRDALQAAFAAAAASTSGDAAWVALAGDALNADAVVGGVSATLDNPGAAAADARARLDHLLIAPAWRDHGLAARLLDTAEASAAGGGRRWALAVLRPQTEAQGWTRAEWAARGYRYYRRAVVPPAGTGAERAARRAAHQGDRVARGGDAARLAPHEEGRLCSPASSRRSASSKRRARGRCASPRRPCSRTRSSATASPSTAST